MTEKGYREAQKIMKTANNLRGKITAAKGNVAKWTAIEASYKEQMLPEKAAEFSLEENNTIMKKQLTGIELIAKERQEQLEKHGRTVDQDVRENADKQLTIGARALLFHYPAIKSFPITWSNNIIHHMASKDYKERLIIAGALIAAELDRLQFIDSTKQ